MTRRLVPRLAAMMTGLLLPFVASAPAWALDNGEIPDHMSTWDIVLIYVLAPVGGVLLITAVVALPSLLRRPRYRPGRPWAYEPLWFGGPEDPEGALVAGRGARTAKGGASGDW